MLLAHKIEIRPTKEQEEKLLQWVGCARHCYNNLLAHFSQNGVKFNKKSAREFYYNTIRVENIWHKDTSQNLQQSVIDDLEDAYKRFFKTKKGYPKFHKRGVKDSFSVRSKAKFRVDGNNLYIEKFNKGKADVALKLREKVRFAGIPKQITVSTKAGKWFASILVEVEQGYNCKQPKDNTSVGIDLGIKTLVTTSDRQSIGN